MNILSDFIKEYKATYIPKQTVFEKGLVGDIKKIKEALLDPKFLPSAKLEALLDKQIKRATYPMEVAITGQFSAGKSTFLNALLSKNILPTGITPVTSKVNFINYGPEYKLKITYKSGLNEYHGIEKIASFTDQREHEMQDIKYLTLYAPMDILKDISFVDTPGLNSQSQSDTDTTKKVLRDVGGIIWLTLIDNAGKQSEAKILEEYMSQFKNKSLCVLNQKDKFTQEQIETTVNYVKDKFSQYFAQVTPISAKLALEAREEQQDVLIKTAYENIINEFKFDLKNNKLKDFSFFEDKYKKYIQEINKIHNVDTSSNEELIKQSNIQEVLNFINNTIRPQAAEAKEFAIKKDLRNFCDILIKEYHIIISVFESLCEILKESENEVISGFNNIETTYSKELFTIHNSLESTMQMMSTTIYKNIKNQKSCRFEDKSSFLNKNSYERIEYNTYWIDTDNIFKQLFYDDQTVDKIFKKIIKEFKQVQLNSDIAFRDVYRLLKHKVQQWQEPYELLKPHREIASDLEFSKTRHFAAKSYENVLKYYHRAILENISALHKKFAYFSGALNHSYMQATQATISHFEQQINESVLLYEKEPTKFNIYHPREDEILTKLKANFAFEKIDDFLTSKRNYLFKIIQYSKDQYLTINKERILFVESKKDEYIQKIEDLKTIQASI